MYATIRSYDDPAFAARLQEREEELRSVLGAIEGFRAYYLIGAGDGTFSVTVTDDQAGAERSTQVAADWLRDNMPDAPRPTRVSTGEVAVSI